jgi:hypothetical protein
MRTPKMGIDGKKENKIKNAYTRSGRFPFHIFTELFFAAYTGAGIISAIVMQKYMIIPFLSMYFFAFGIVFFMSLKQYIKQNKAP